MKTENLKNAEHSLKVFLKNMQEAQAEAEAAGELLEPAICSMIVETVKIQLDLEAIQDEANQEHANLKQRKTT